MTNPTSSLPTGSTPSLRYRPDIDGLRAIAVGLVLIFHFRLLPGLGDAGFLGVDVFFVISGYLITRIVWEQLSQGRFHLGSFYLHRVRRLAPALQVTLLLSLAMAAWTSLPAGLLETVRQAVVTQTYVANLYFWRNVSYFGLSADQVPWLHAWSLAVEEQFYVFYPLGLWLLHRGGRPRLLPWLWGAALLSFGLNLWGVSHKPDAAFYLLPTRAWELLMGALLARYRQHIVWTLLPGAVWASIGLLCLVLGVATHEPGMPVPGWHALWPTVGAVCLIAAGEHGREAQGLGPWLGSAPMVFLGRISYPAYLVHWPLHVFMQQQWAERYDLTWRAAMFVASLILAAGIHWGVERPVQRAAWASSPRRLGAVYAACLLSLGLCWWLAERSGGWPGRLSPQAQAWAAAAADRAPELPGCDVHPEQGKALSDDRLCTLGNPQAPTLWLILGDSHAWAVHEALDRWLRERGESARLAFVHGCPPLLGVHMAHDKGRCGLANAQLAEWGAAEPGLKSVMLISTWRQAAEGWLVADPEAPINAARSLALLSKQLPITVAHWRQAGLQVWLWDPVPGGRSSVPEALARTWERGGRGDDLKALGWTRREYLDEFQVYLDAARRLTGPGVGRVQWQDVLCPGGDGARCRLLDEDGRPLYFDGAHPSRSTSSVWLQGLHQIPAP